MKTLTKSLYPLAVVILTAATLQAAPIPASQLEFFEKEVRPILVNHCYDCHSEGAKRLKGNLRLDTRDGVREGGDSGPAIVLKKPKLSLLIQVLEGTHADIKQMPPKKPLSATQIARLKRWIALGAPDPRVEEAETVAAASSIDYDKGRTFWAFQEPRVAKVAPTDSTWTRSPIDQYVLARLIPEQVKPVGDAPRQTLIRRMYYDLIGLPPTPEQVTAFVEDRSPGAVAKVVDELLASRHFGERWGRHWLDVARYAESTGMERNYTYPVAWRYRDYVIRSFNQDKPFDRFIREQIAGDLLPAKNADDEAAHLVATAFLAMGPKSLNERNKEIFNMDIVDEQIDVTTRAFMALTVSCARCHDHKFDPISQMDYYSMAGFFTSTKTHFGTGGGGGNRQPSTLIAMARKPRQN